MLSLSCCCQYLAQRFTRFQLCFHGLHYDILDTTKAGYLHHFPCPFRINTIIPPIYSHVASPQFFVQGTVTFSTLTYMASNNALCQRLRSGHMRLLVYQRIYLRTIYGMLTEGSDTSVNLVRSRINQCKSQSKS